MEQHREQQQRDAIDAYRPNSDDLELAEFSSLAKALERDDEPTLNLLRKVQNVDDAIGQAVRDVEVPGDLAARLQAAVERVELAAPQHETDAAQADSSSDTRQGSSRMRRRWLAAAAVLAPILLAVAAAPFWFSRDTMDGVEVAEEASTWPNKSEFEGPWRLVSSSPAPLDNRPYSERVTSKPVKWRRYATRWDRRSAVYLDDLSYRSDVLLFVIKTSQGDRLSSAPPGKPFFRSGGRQIAVWKERDCVYVLIIDGPDNYDRVAPRGPGFA